MECKIKLNREKSFRSHAVNLNLIFVLDTGNGISRTYMVALAVVFSILFVVIVLSIVFIVCIKKLQSSEEKILLKNVDLKSYKTLD